MMGETKPRNVRSRHVAYINTPYGIFTSILRASQSLGYDRRTVQRYVDSHDHVYSEWFVHRTKTSIRTIRKSNVNKVLKKPNRDTKPRPDLIKIAVRTPGKIYMSAVECAADLNMSYHTVLYRLSRCADGSFPEWEWFKYPIERNPQDPIVLQEAADKWDEILFDEGLWLVSTTKITGKDLDKALIKYEFGHTDYELTVNEWNAGKRPHLEEN